MKFSTTVLSATLLAGALALAGCGGGSGNGGGGDDTTTTTPRDTNAGDCGEGTKLEGGKCVSTTQPGKSGHEIAATLHNQLHEDRAKDGYGIGPIDIANPAAGDGINARQSEYADALSGDKYQKILMAQGKAFNAEYSGATLAADEAGYYPIGASAPALLVIDASKGGQMADADVFATHQAKTYRRTISEGSPGNEKTVFETMGTYHGVPGTYRCVGDASTQTACGSHVLANGDLQLTGPSGTGEGWFFKPNMASANVVNFGRWGWWFTRERGGDVDQVGVFYHAHGKPALTDSTNLELSGGSAKYTGEASGLFSVHSVEANAGRSGRFDADVELNATFGTNPALSGKIDNFTGEGTDPAWVVSLNGDGTSSTGTGNMNGAGMASGTTSWTRGTDTQTINGGMWDARMYGGTGSATPVEVVTPTAVLGGFHAQHDDGGQMMGAFQATPE